MPVTSKEFVPDAALWCAGPKEFPGPKDRGSWPAQVPEHGPRIHPGTEYNVGDACESLVLTTCHSTTTTRRLDTAPV